MIITDLPEPLADALHHQSHDHPNSHTASNTSNTSNNSSSTSCCPPPRSPQGLAASTSSFASYFDDFCSTSFCHDHFLNSCDPYCHPCEPCEPCDPCDAPCDPCDAPCDPCDAPCDPCDAPCDPCVDVVDDCNMCDHALHPQTDTSLSMVAAAARLISNAHHKSSHVAPQPIACSNCADCECTGACFTAGCPTAVSAKGSSPVQAAAQHVFHVPHKLNPVQLLPAHLENVQSRMSQARFSDSRAEISSAAPVKSVMPVQQQQKRQASHHQHSHFHSHQHSHQHSHGHQHSHHNNYQPPPQYMPHCSSMAPTMPPQHFFKGPTNLHFHSHFTDYLSSVATDNSFSSPPSSSNFSSRSNSVVSMASTVHWDRMFAPEQNNEPAHIDHPAHVKQELVGNKRQAPDMSSWAMCNPDVYSQLNTMEQQQQPQQQQPNKRVHLDSAAATPVSDQQQHPFVNQATPPDSAHSTPNSAALLQCQWDNCEVSVQDTKALALHELIHQPTKVHEPSSGDAQIRCEWKNCTFVCGTPELLMMHIQHDHVLNVASGCQTVVKAETKPITTAPATTTVKEEPLVCRWICEGSTTECGTHFDSTKLLNDHVVNDHVGLRKNSYTCRWADCERCLRPFTQRQKIHRHLITHTRHKPHVCPQCGNAFSEALVLQQHSRVHSGEKPFGCQLCPRRFAASTALSVHMRTHTGEKPLQCKWPGCEKRFSESSNLTKHMKTHQAGKAHACSVAGCDRKFTRNDQLQRHLKTHEKNDNPVAA